MVVLVLRRNPEMTSRKKFILALSPGLSSLYLSTKVDLLLVFNMNNN